MNSLDLGTRNETKKKKKKVNIMSRIFKKMGTTNGNKMLQLIQELQHELKEGWRLR